jgi:hypothetical protein
VAGRNGFEMLPVAVDIEISARKSPPDFDEAFAALSRIEFVKHLVDLLLGLRVGNPDVV